LLFYNLVFDAKFIICTLISVQQVDYVLVLLLFCTLLNLATVLLELGLTLEDFCNLSNNTCFTDLKSLILDGFNISIDTKYLGFKVQLSLFDVFFIRLLPLFLLWFIKNLFHEIIFWKFLKLLNYHTIFCFGFIIFETELLLICVEMANSWKWGKYIWRESWKQVW